MKSRTVLRAIVDEGIRYGIEPVTPELVEFSRKSGFIRQSLRSGAPAVGPFIARTDRGTLVGVALADWHHGDYHGDGLLLSVYVDPHVREQGIGQQLVKMMVPQVKKFLKEYDINWVYGVNDHVFSGEVERNGLEYVDIEYHGGGPPRVKILSPHG